MGDGPDFVVGDGPALVVGDGRAEAGEAGDERSEDPDGRDRARPGTATGRLCARAGSPPAEPPGSRNDVEVAPVGRV